MIIDFKRAIELSDCLVITLHGDVKQSPIVVDVDELWREFRRFVKVAERRIELFHPEVDETAIIVKSHALCV